MAFRIPPRFFEWVLASTFLVLNKSFFTFMESVLFVIVLI